MLQRIHKLSASAALALVMAAAGSASAQGARGQQQGKQPDDVNVVNTPKVEVVNRPSVQAEITNTPTVRVQQDGAYTVAGVVGLDPQQNEVRVAPRGTVTALPYTLGTPAELRDHDQLPLGAGARVADADVGGYARVRVSAKNLSRSRVNVEVWLVEDGQIVAHLGRLSLGGLGLLESGASAAFDAPGKAIRLTAYYLPAEGATPAGQVGVVVHGN